MRLLLASLVVLALVSLQETFPPQSVPLETFPPQSMLQETFPPQSPGAPSVYADATAVWTFNDPAALGTDDSGNGNDLTAVNAPTATGGALGYAMRTLTASSQRADTTGMSALDEDLGLTVAGWQTVDDFATSHGAMRLAAGGSQVLNWLFNVSGTAEVVNFWTCTGTAATTNSVSAGERAFVVVRWDGAGTIDVSLNDGGADSMGPDCTLAADPTDIQFPSSINGNFAANDSVEGVHMLWNTKVSDAVVTSLYNAGKGKECADLTAAEQVGMVSCWEMDEDGGPYADSIGSHDLTAVNAPTRTVGLVGRGDSGTALSPGAAGTGYLHDDTADRWDRDFSTDYSFAVWFNTPVAAAEYLMWQDDATTATWYLAGTSIGQVTCMMREAGLERSATTFGGTITSNTWHLAVCTYSASDHKVRLSVDGATFVESVALSSFYNGGNVTELRLPSATTKPNAIDNAAVWYGRALSQTDAEDLWASGVGQFYAAVWDAIFEGPRFAWSARPEVQRIP